jgi:hypothetical protein
LNREGAKGAKFLFESGSEEKTSLHDSHKEPENTVGDGRPMCNYFRISQIESPPIEHEKISSSWRSWRLGGWADLI